MADKPTPKPPTDWLTLFKQWAAGRTGLSITELVEAFADIFKLTTAERKKLLEQVKAEQPKQPKEEPKKPPEKPKPKEPTVKPELVISRTPYPKWWKDARTWNINIIEAGTWAFIPKTPGYRTYIATLVFTVSGETNIILQFGIFPPTGPMDFGGEGEPRGIVIAMGDSPAPCGDGGFIMTSDGAGVLVSGFVVYYYEKEQT